MAYSETLMLTADEVLAGQDFNIYVFLQNLTPGGFTLYVETLLRIDGAVLSGEYRSVLAWADRNTWMTLKMTEYGPMYHPYWKFSFTMPNNAVNVVAESWVEQEAAGISWHLDSYTEKIIPVKELPPEFANFAIESYEGLLTL